MDKLVKALLIFGCTLLMVAVVELAAIWWELRITNRDQLKSAYAVLPESISGRIPEPQMKALQSTLHGISEDVNVTTENGPLEVTIAQ